VGKVGFFMHVGVLCSASDCANSSSVNMRLVLVFVELG